MSLENAFKAACERHEHLKLLESQWSFDKELISKALQNIGAIFPHYSRHDASHSRQIIVNIERMLGDRINHLSATDMWLLLEAAYNHDIGMVVTNKQIRDLDTKEFRAFVEDICDKPEHELYTFAKNWLDGVLTLPSGSAAHILFNEYRQLIAEWYRRKHPENAAKIINDPLAEIGLSSPRNELLPRRLFSVLAAICNAHGDPFEKVMALPFSEAGMATEDCHPRYIAFLLRMGDLLDIDDNRFCPVMMRMSGDRLPKESHAHFEKHRSVKHFRLDSEGIKVEVNCPSPQSYEIAHGWFSWMEKEYHSQSQHWTEIVPNEKLGRLPALAPPKVTIADPFLIINEGQRPDFEINKESMLRLLRGTGLYSSKVDSIREILQNAVDSTIVAIWEKNKELIPSLDPSQGELIRMYDQHMIDVDLTEKEDETGAFTLSVTDRGFGISRDDLKHILKIGNSSKSKKSRLIKEMPQWFRPSGNFGIGLQSIYLLSEKFTIKTKSRVTHEALMLTFTSGNESSVVIQKIAAEEVEYGAVVSIDIKLAEFPESMSMPHGEPGKELARLLNGYDFTEAGSNLCIYEQAKILFEIDKFNDGSPIKITSHGRQLTTSRDNSYFSKRQNLAISKVGFNAYDSNQLQTLFRGQEFDDLSFSGTWVSLTADFHGYQASDFLSYNRAKILPEAKDKAREQLTEVILEYIDLNFNSIEKSQKPYAAAFHYLNTKKNRDRYEAELMNFEVQISGQKTLTISEILNGIEKGQIQKLSSGSLYRHELSTGRDVGVPSDLSVLAGDRQDSVIRLIQFIWTKRGNFSQEQDLGRPFSHVCFFSKEDIQAINDDNLKKIMKGKTGFWKVGKRILIPAWSKYRSLSVNATLSWARIYHHGSYTNDYLLLPYKFDHEGERAIDMSEDLMQWIFNNRKYPDVTAEQIRSISEELVHYLEEFMEKSA